MVTAKKDKKETYQNIRLPLVGSYFHRTDDIELYLTDGKDQQFVNCYFDKITNPLTGTESFKVKKRPGWVDSGTAYSGVTSNGILSARTWYGSFNGATIVLSIWVTGANEAQLFSNTTSIGTIAITGADEASHITLAKSGTTQALLFWVAGSAGTNREAYFYPDGGALTEITDADFPDTTMRGDFVFMDGYAFIITEAGDIYNSDLNSLSAWTSTSFLNSGAQPDQGVTLARYKDKIVAFNASSIEFFELNPNPPTTGSVLQRVNHLAILDIGCYKHIADRAKVDVVEYLDTLFWLSGGVQINTPSNTALYMLNNYQPVKISTPEIDAIISLDYRLEGAITFQGHHYIILYNRVDSEFFFFNIDTKAWFRWKLGFTTGEYCPVIQGNTGGQGAISMFRGTDRYHIFTDTDPTSFVYQDDGNTYTMKIQTSKIDFGTNKRKRLHKLDVIGDKQATANNLSINWSDDDYGTFSTARTVAMGDTRPYLNNCGIFRRRSFKLEHSANTACELEAIELEYSQMET